VLECSGADASASTISRMANTDAFRDRVHAAQLFEPITGRTLDVWTTEPGVQVYTGNFLDGTIIEKDGRTYARRGAVCLETAHFPDTPNHPSFPSAVLRPGQMFTS
jgi:aldose 1-epimerase